jgi:DNA primase catalytic core
MEKSEDYLILTENLKLHLRDYIEEKHPDGVTPTGLDAQFRCLKHSPDNNPSMFIGHNIPQVAKCRVCDATLSIFHAHHELEGAPIYGRDFLEKNLNVLALKYGYEPLEVAALTEDQLFMMKLYDIHTAASEILKAGEVKGGVISRDFCKQMGITDAVADEMAIGTVTDVGNFIAKICAMGNWSSEEVESAGVRESKFGPTILSYTIHDKRGRPIGFAGRDWRFDGRFGVPHEPTFVDGKGIECKRAKWVNSTTSVIYEKANTLYGYHKAKKYNVDSKVYVVEGYADAAVLWSYGLDNVVCVGSTAFSPRHVQMLKDADKTIIVICLDNDEAGLKATDKILEQGFKNVPFIKGQVLLVPPTKREDGKLDVDPDTFIKVNGLDSFTALVPLNAFEYTIGRIPDVLEDDDQKDLFVKRFIPIIMNETSAITQQAMRKAIANRIGVGEALIREYQSNMERVHNTERREMLKKEHFKFRKQFEDALLFEPEKAVSLASFFRDKVNESMNAEYTVKMGIQEVLDGFSCWREERETAEANDLFWKTGWEFWDLAIGGIQKTDCFIGVAGPANHGKSAILTNITLGLLDNNPLEELMVLYWTIDDTRDTLFTKLAAIMAKQMIYNVFTYKTQPDQIKSAINVAMARLEKFVRNHNLLVKGAEIGKSGEDVKKWVALMQERYPERKMVLMIDNFSNMTGPGDELQVQAHNIEILHSMRCDMNLAIVSSLEMNKEGFEGRASSKNLRGSGKIFYRLTRTITVFNDHREKEQNNNHNPEVFWVDSNGAKRPVMEACFGKSKNMSPEAAGGSNYFQFEPTIGLLTEIGPQSKWDKFQIENNQSKNHTDLGLASWISYDKKKESKALAPVAEQVQPEVKEEPESQLTSSESLQDASSPFMGKQDDFDPLLSDLDDDGL